MREKQYADYRQKLRTANIQGRLGLRSGNIIDFQLKINSSRMSKTIFTKKIHKPKILQILNFRLGLL